MWSIRTAPALRALRRGHGRVVANGTSTFAPNVTPDQIWTFARHDQRLLLHRRQASDGFVFVVDGDGPARSYFFTDLDPLVAFHRDMEWFLLRTGWSLVGYSPERRVVRDRRKVLRTMAPDRRRTMPSFMLPSETL
jgi:hypothetical protein